MPLIRGDELRPDLQREVLRRYVHRHTIEHPFPNAYRPASAAPAPTVTDAEWLRAHAFYVTRSGHLDERRHYAEPAIIANALPRARSCGDHYPNDCPAHCMKRGDRFSAQQIRDTQQHS